MKTKPRMEIVWIQNLKGFIEGKFPADERWKKIFVDQLNRLNDEEHPSSEHLEEALKTVLASLVATTSLIIRAEDMKVKPSKAVASDLMFTQMLKDYDKATIVGREALKRCTV